MEQPKQYTPEEIAQFEKSRTISDAELLKGGAEYAINKEGEKVNLSMAQDQEFDHESEAERNRQRLVYENIKQLGLKSGDKVKVKLVLPEKTYSRLAGRYITAEELETAELYLVGDAKHSDVFQVTTTPSSEWLDVEDDRLWQKGYFDIDFGNLKSVEKIEN